MSRKPENNTVAPDFDDDIIAEILLRLPANSLLRFRCVCKSWLALISAPSFVKNHLSRVNTKHFNLLVGTWPSQASVLKDDDGDIAITVLDYPVTSWSPCPALYPIIYGSCNGLMCIEFEYGNLILWKPCTRAFKQLPEPELDCREYGETFIYLAGFGYDSTIADYKVIRGSKINEDPTTLQVFTLKTGSWRTNPDFNHIKEGSECIFAVEKQGLLLNETLHWVALLRGPEYEKGTLGIVSIGLAEEKFQVMALFPCRRPSPDSFISTSIMTVGNSLFVYHEFDIWMMKEYGVEQSWTQVIYISPQILPFPQHVDYRLTPLCIFENGQILVNHGRTFGLYNPEEKTFKIVISNCEAYPRYYTAYVETLVLPLTGMWHLTL